MTHSTRPRRTSRRPAAPRAFSIVECAIAMVIVGVALVAAVSAVGSARSGELRLTSNRQALVLAQDLMAEIAAQPYSDATDTTTVFGPTGPESAPGNRSLFDDVNDYHAFTESPPLTKAGASLGLDATWTRSVAVGFVSPTDPNVASATDQGLAKIAVRVTRNGIPLAYLYSLRSAGLPATERCTLSDGTSHNLAPAHCMALGGTSDGPGSNAWTTAEPPDITTDVGLVAHWKMDETSGSTAADSKGANHATLTNGPTFTIAGMYANALNLDGTNDYAVVNHSSELSINSTLTLSAWVYPTSIPDDERWYGIFHKGQTSSTRNYFIRLYNGTISFGFRDTTGTTQRFEAGSVATPNQWYHVAATYVDATDKVVIYLNGVAVGTFTTTRTPQTNTSALNIGNGYSGISTDYFKGQIDDARIYNRALSAAEIATLSAKAPPVAYWRLNDSSGTTASDSAGSNDGTLNSGPTWTTGQMDDALWFDGVNDYVSIPNSAAFQVTNRLTIAAWIRGEVWPTSGGGDNGWTSIILRKGDVNPNNWQLSVYQGKVTLHLALDDDEGVRGTTTLALNKWYHVAGTWDGDKVRIYVDGVLNNTPASKTSAIPTDTRPVYLGGRTGSTDIFKGKLDDVRFYNRALSAAEITTLFGGGEP